LRPGPRVRMWTVMAPTARRSPVPIRIGPPANALMLEAMLAGHKVQCPPALYAEYREVLEPFAEPALSATPPRARSPGPAAR